MFDGLGKSKFSMKCKSAVRLMKTRLEMVKKKRTAMQKYLRSDILDLLRHGLDVNAYGRAEGLLVEMNMCICYDFVDQFCEHISNNLAAMAKQRECPEECKEAVSSLVYAAARFADLPELRELRTIFVERYGNSVDSFVNQEFVEKLKSMSPTMEMKFQVLQEIATAADIYWNPIATEKKLNNFPRNVRNDNHRPAKRIEHGAPEECNPHRVSHNPGERTPFRVVQMDTTRNGHHEDFHDRQASSYSSIPPPYTKSKDRDESVSESNRKPASTRKQRLKPGSSKDNKESAHGIGYTEPPPEQATGRAARRQSWDVTPSYLVVEPTEARKGHARAASVQPEMLNPIGHVHPKLPNYEDFVARLSSLKGGS